MTESPEPTYTVPFVFRQGLGKSFTTIALLYTVLTHSSMISSVDGANLVRTVLVVVPVNTLANWENEFQKWLDHLPNSPSVYNLSLYKSGRKPSVQRWRKKGGVLLVSDSMFSRFFTGSDREWYTKEIQPDVLVLDEAHTMLKNSDTQISKTLNCISTKRRIMLTGSPFQNNLLEYFRMCEFIRPGIFGIASEAKFEKEYAGPIMAGLVSDCSVLAHSISVSKSAELTEIMRPYIHRKDVSTLSKDLPPLTQVVLHVRQSRQQSRLYHAFMREQKRDSELKNFFKMFSELRPIHNHPFCLHMGGDRQTKRRSSIDEEEVAKRVWWEGYYDKQEPLDDVESGYKIVLLLHILAHASNRGEKVLIFSLCLKTLDYIELVLAAPDWKRLVPSLECFSGLKLGEWKKSRDFVRIDGDIQSADRGELVNEFNVSSADGGTLRAFLISSLAGGMGINLTGASRVVLVDSHFNPTISTQALFRAFRYGQTKPVYVYRFLTEGTIEEKVYGRSVNKTGLARRIIDKKTMNRCFSSKEIEDLKQSYQWVQVSVRERRVWCMFVNEKLTFLVLY